jgi:hypothetical protein
VRLATNQARALAVGDANSSAPTVTTYPNKKTGFLGAIRGYEAYTKTLGTAVTIRGPLRTLQVVWANCNAPGAAAGMEQGAGAGAPAGEEA